MPWRGPDVEGELPSLGWLLLDWWYEFLPSPRDESKPLVFSDEQARILIDWYTVDPESGGFVYRRGVSRRAKGWGKSPVEAAKNIAELCGPVRFDGWDANGNPVGRPWGFAGDPEPWVQSAALTEDQTDNTYSVVNHFLRANDGKAADRLRIDHGITRCYLRDRPGRLEPVTTNAGAREGQPVTYGQVDESHLLTPSNGGVKLVRTIRRNAAKMDGRTYETTNSFEPGVGSVAEASHKAAMSGAEGIYYDAVEGPPVAEHESDQKLREALAKAYGDSSSDVVSSLGVRGWVDLDRLVKEARDPDTPWEDVLRFNLNLNVSGQSRAVDPNRWDELAEPRDVPAGTRVGLGFDGSISRDATVLRACTADGYSFIVGKWIRPKGVKDWTVDRTEVDEKVAWAFATYRVGRMLCDPPKWWTDIERWIERYGEEVVLFFDTNQDRRMGPAVDRWLTAIRLGEHTHDADPDTDEHVKAAHKRKSRARDPEDDDRTLYTLTKGEDAGRIDGAVADVLAFEAAMTMPEVQGPVLLDGPLMA